MSREFTGGIKGLAILMVFVIHIAGQFGVPSVQFIAGSGVSLFLILSGYGIECSYRKTGIRWYWVKKILTVLVPYWIVMLACAIYLQYGANELFTKEEIVDGFLLKSSNWYVPYILGCYLIFWIAAVADSILKKVVKDKYSDESSDKMRFILVCILFGIWFIAECLLRDKLNDSELRIRQMLAFPVGMFVANVYDKISDKAAENKKTFGYVITCMVIAFAGLVFTVICQKFTSLPSFVHGILSLFSVFMIALGMLMWLIKFPVFAANRFMGFFGFISYELFLVHWQLMDYVYWKWDGIGRFTICVIIGVALLKLFDRFVIDNLKKKLKSEKLKSE